MKFKPATPNPFYTDHGQRNHLESETGRWSIVSGPTVTGNTRIYAGITNAAWYALDNCGGNQMSSILEVFAVTISFVEQFDESASEDEVRRAWPHFQYKPLTDNPEWSEFRDRVLAASTDSLIL